MADASSPDPWSRLRAATPARIAQSRTGRAVALGEVLAFQLAHARARDAVHAPFDADGVAAAIAAAARETVIVRSRASSRDVYLRRPDLGRTLDETSRAAIARRSCDLVIVVADGLSATAAARGGAGLAIELAAAAEGRGLSVGPIAIASMARVALGDEIAAAAGASAVAMLIGERPGLSVPDSLGAYLTFNPKPGVSTDADRNCVSNIHAAGLSPADAVGRILWLLVEARRRGATGVTLKDESALKLLPGA